MSGWIPDEGLRFECTACGACCTGPPGYVSYTEAEARALARRLGLSVDEFEAAYTHETPMGRSIREVETEHGYDCVFLDRESVPGKAVCSVYEDRPLQCRTFPWWPEHVRNKASWDELERECEGVHRGGFVPVEEITRNLEAQRARDGNVAR
ncbi:MAG: YkgJ family cysteine cluster protein [Phycisphaerales bacterium]